MKNTFLIFSLLVLGACSSMEPKAGWRQVQLEAGWIKQISQNENYRFTKLSRSKPLIFKSLVIAGSSNGGIAAFDRKTGAQKWYFPIEFGVEASPSLYNKNRVIFGAKDGYIYSLDANTGKLIWKFFAKAEVISDALVAGGQVYVLSGANVLYSLDADDGRQKWVYSRVQRTTFSVRGGSQALLKNGLLYLGFSDGFFVALNSQDGSLKWERRLGTNNKLQDVDMSPVADSNSVYVASYDGALYSLSLDNGKVNWRLDVGGYSAPLLDGKKLIYPTTNRSLLVVDAGSGKKEWETKLSDVAGSPVKINNLWFLSLNSGESVMIDSVEKKVVATYAPGRGSMAQALFDKENSYLFVNSNAGNLHAIKYSVRDRRKTWPWEK